MTDGTDAYFVPFHSPAPAARPGLPVRAWATIVGGLLLALLASAGAATFMILDVTREPLTDAQARCAPGSDRVVVSPDGARLEIDGWGTEDSAGASYEQVMCILDELAVPPDVRSEIAHTRAMDGTREAGWDGYTVAWQYRPADGMDMTISRADVA